MSAIEVTGLRKRFGPVLALNRMTFTVTPGQVTGFIGPRPVVTRWSQGM